LNLDYIAQWLSALSNSDAIQRLPELLLDWAQDHRTTLYILFALAVGFALGRSRASRDARAAIYQNRGEALLSHVVQANLGYPDYHLMNHVTLLLEDGTTQVDHILVSRFGVFVIETKHYKGWIFADAKQPNWTQVLFNLRFKFQNPVFQNSRHVRAVHDLLEFLPPGAIGFTNRRVQRLLGMNALQQKERKLPRGLPLSACPVVRTRRKPVARTSDLNRCASAAGVRLRRPRSGCSCSHADPPAIGG
jgi:hypothetical protein